MLVPFHFIRPTHLPGLKITSSLKSHIELLKYVFFLVDSNQNHYLISLVIFKITTG